MSNGRQDLGPLPGTDRNDELERESMTALDGILPTDRFRVRSEPGRDQGVDRYIEVLIESSDTNFRAQLQAKAKETANENQDGSVSHSIETSNLNYLLNGPCPVYFLWISDRRELRVVWARDEQRRIEDEGTDWRSQASVTLRFSRLVLDCIDEIYGRILAEGRLRRLIQEAMLRHALAEAVSVQVDPATLEITDATTAFNRLLDSGIPMVAAGHSQPVLNLLGVLNSEQRSSPRVHLLAGYAHFVRDRFHLARGELAESALRRDELPETDGHFLDRLLNACDVQLGHIDESEYNAREAGLMQNSGALVNALNRLDELRYAHIRERDRIEKGRILEEMIQVANNVILAQNTPVAARFMARAAIAYAEGHELTTVYLRELQRVLVPAPWDEAGLLALPSISTPDFVRWKQGIYGLINEAQRVQHPLAIADAYYALGASNAALLIMVRASETVAELVHPEVEELTNHTVQALQEAARKYEVVRALRSVLLTRMVEADIAEADGRETESRSLAQDISRQASIMLYHDIQRSAEELLQERSHFRVLVGELDRADRLSDDELHANASDEDLHRMADDMADSFRIPRERAVNIEDQLGTQRQMSRERLDWCRYIEMLSKTEHEQSPETMYRDPPEYACHCRLFESRLTEAEGTWLEAIEEFKARHCAACDRREPLRSRLD